MKPLPSTLGYDPNIELYLVDADGNEYGVSFNYEGEWQIVYYQYPSTKAYTSYKSSDLNEVREGMCTRLPPSVFDLINGLIESLKPYEHLMEVNPTWWKD